MSNSKELPLAFRPHDHNHCISRALSGAELICQRQGVRLTPLRKRVLEHVWKSHEPLGAYDILAILAQEDGRLSAPPTVYRALDFLLENGLVHRLASLNAYIGCNHPGASHQGQFLICRQCRNVIETDNQQLVAAIGESAGRLGFQVEGQMVEVIGLCASCQQQP